MKLSAKINTGVKELSVLREYEMGASNPNTYGSVGELMRSYLNMHPVEGFFGIVGYDDVKEIYIGNEDVSFVEDFGVDDVYVFDPATESNTDALVGYVSFGKVTINGLTFKAVAEFNYSPITIYVSQRTCKTLRNSVCKIRNWNERNV